MSKEGKQFLFYFVISFTVLTSLYYLLAPSQFNLFKGVSSYANEKKKSEKPKDAAQKEKKKEISLAKWNEQKTAFLTFDDGPSDFTAQILDVLKKENVKATFFMLGPNVEKNESIIKRMVKEGHYPASHSMTHKMETTYASPNSLVKEMEQTSGAIEKASGVKSKLVRLPFGSSAIGEQPFIDGLANAKFKMWDWSIESGDWQYNTSNQKEIVENIKKQLSKKKEVILLHEKEVTLNVLPEIIALLKKEGYQLEAYNPDYHVVENFWKDERL